MTTGHSPRICVHITDEQDSRLDHVVELGYFMSRSEALRAGLRFGVRHRLALYDVDDPLVKGRKPRIDREQVFFRVPGRLRDDAERFGDLSSVVRRSLELLADEYLEGVIEA